MKNNKVELLRIISRKATGKPNKGRTVVEVLRNMLDDYPDSGVRPPNIDANHYLLMENGEQMATETGELIILES